MWGYSLIPSHSFKQLSSSLCPTCRPLLSIFCRAGLVSVNSLLFFWVCLNFSLTLEGQFCQIQAYWLIIFLFLLWIYGSIALWPPKVLMIYLLMIPLKISCMSQIVSLDASKIPFVFIFRKCDYNVSQWVLECFELFRFLYSHFFIKFGIVSFYFNFRHSNRCVIVSHCLSL